MEAKRAPEYFDPKCYYKQMTTNFNGQQDGFENDDLLEDDFDMVTPQFSTENGQQKNEFDVDMEEIEETKMERSSSTVFVPVEEIRQASKSLQVNQQHI